MPLYEYKCQSCGETFEVIQKFSEAPLRVHTKCGGPVERLISPPALQFKGTGWYVTDYAGSGNGKPKEKSDAKKTSPAATDSPAKPETKSPSNKPAGSSDKKV